MNRTFAMLVAVVVVGMSIGVAGAGNVNINIGAPAIIMPPIVTAPPPVVIVPGTPVYTVPSASFNMFVYRDRYYSFHHDAWFVTIGAGTPWQRVAVEQVPQVVRAVPMAYYRIPPGQAKKMDASSHERGRGCPPGLAKQGRC
jgi:hypothetical protein